MKKACGIFIGFCFLAFAISVYSEENQAEAMPLEKLFDSEGKIFEKTPGEFMKNKTDKYFKWNSSAKETARASSLSPDLGPVSFLGFKVWECLARFKDGKIYNVDLYLYDKGDAGTMGKSQFFAAMRQINSKLNGWIGVKGEKLPKKRMQRNYIFSKAWKKAPYLYTLKWSYSKSRVFEGEYIQLDVSKLTEDNDPDKNHGFDNKPVAKKSSGKLEDNVKKESNGDVFIENVPMVDQGAKGYCAVAVVERILRYYGQDVDQHQIAQAVGTSETGTDLNEMFKALKGIGAKLRVRLKELYVSDTMKMYELDWADRRVWSRACKVISNHNRFARKAGVDKIKSSKFVTKANGYITYHIGDMLDAMTPEGVRSMRLNGEKYEYKKFLKKVKEYVDSGIPVCWGVHLGKVKEEKLNPQASGGHMRLIIGYNDKEKKIIYTDTWGAGHSFKKMDYDNAWYITSAVCVLFSRDVKRR